MAESPLSSWFPYAYSRRPGRELSVDTADVAAAVSTLEEATRAATELTHRLEGLVERNERLLERYDLLLADLREQADWQHRVGRFVLARLPAPADEAPRRARFWGLLLPALVGLLLATGGLALAVHLATRAA